MAVTTQSISVAAPAASLQGLTDKEAAERRAKGMGNKVQGGTGRTYMDILRTNVFTFINDVLFIIGIALVIMGSFGDAIVTAGVMLINVVVGVVQETKAKRQLDKIALLTRPKATVIRNGLERSIDPGQLVVGDLIVVRAGDQIVVDGVVVGEGKMDVDESLLTGESDLIPKKSGDEVYSGSFCVTGSAMFEARKVGADSLANKITAGAKAFRAAKTPLQHDIDFVVRVLIITVTVLGVLLTLSLIRQQLHPLDMVRNAAVIAGLVPQGLFFMVAVSYAVGAVRMSGKGALIQQSNAVESLSNINVLCLDKTGTLTTNAIKLNALHPLTVSEQEMARIVGDYVCSTKAGNKTSEACKAAYPGIEREIVEEVPFSSARKWSAISFGGPELMGTYVMGAPEMLHPYMQTGADLGDEQAKEWADKGLRVLMFAYKPEVVSLQGGDGQPALPRDLVPLGIISFSDVLRPEADQALKGFAEAGIKLKIISGDNPHTVAALARQAGFSGEMSVVSGIDLNQMNEKEFENAATENTVFGRITPQQKEKLVSALRAKGHYVAMIGDGVNDVLSLKKANLGIAMQSGSQATRGVADMVLLNDSFGALPNAFKEGQRIINGMNDVVRLLLTRTMYLMLLIVGSAMVDVASPIVPKHNSVLAVLTVGIPTVALVAWARIGSTPKRLLRSVTHFVVPASLMVAIFSLAVYVGYWFAHVQPYAAGTAAYDAGVNLARTAVTTVMVLCGLILIPFVEPPVQMLVAGDEYSGDRRPTYLSGVMLAIFLAVMIVPPFRNFFELSPLGIVDVLIILAVVAAWAVSIWYIWRARYLERVVQAVSDAVLG